MKRLIVVLVVMLLMVACGGGGDDTAQRIIGKWSGALENENGDVFPSNWEFTGDGKLIVIVAPDSLNITQVADYWFDDDGALRMQDPNSDDEPGRREIEFITDDTMTLTAVNSGIVTTLTRITE